MPTVALIGNPNSGKSTVFNGLTGLHQRIGNWPGVTVELASGTVSTQGVDIDIVDLPGTYDLEPQAADVALDEQVVLDFLSKKAPDLIVNVLDASTLARGLYLTSQLTELGIPLLVVLNMVDVAELNGTKVDAAELSNRLNCPVVTTVATKSSQLVALKEKLVSLLEQNESVASKAEAQPKDLEPSSRYAEVDIVVKTVQSTTTSRNTWHERIDAVVLNRWVAFPIFLAVMYLMFTFTINIGSAFIDFFDIVGQTIFVDSVSSLLGAIGTPEWLSALLANGVGGGVQLVMTFIPVITCLFLFLAMLENCGYMGRIAFILDRLLSSIGLPGQAFVPLIVGFGCNVPSVMAVRTLNNEPDRILTTIMAPYMSCGARLTVYALFAAAFFPVGGQNLVFLLYILGLLAAIGSAWVVRRRLMPHSHGSHTVELPAYHVPTLRSVLTQTWHRLRGFIVRAGKAIVLVVVILNVLSSVGKDGSFGNENTSNSMLAVIGQTITPAFAPIGLTQDNWPATVGIFTGFFAKEVVVGTLDALYSEAPATDADFDMFGQFSSAFATIPANLSDLGSYLSDPLGIALEETSNLDQAAATHEVEISTITAMQNLFDGAAGAFSYLLFVLLYVPCVATIGVIYKELNLFWAAFTTTWSIVMAYCAATVCYQLLTITVAPLQSIVTLGVVVLVGGLMFFALLKAGSKHVESQARLIPIQAV